MKDQSDAETTLAETKTKTAEAPSAAATKHGGGKLGEVVIHVRFHPTGLVNTINQRPEYLSPQDWFDRLCRAAPLTYQPLSGGRGAFRIPSDDFDVILSENAR